MLNVKWLGAVAVVAASVLVGCQGGGDGAGGDVTIQISGSDTMINVAQAWAEEYKKTHPDVKIEVRGGGSGVGIADLTAGKVVMANASRKMKPKEHALAKKNTGKEPVEYIVGLDALAIYIHPDNPVDELTLAQLADVYGADKKVKQWADLGVEFPGELVCVSRQNSSGTYAYFKEAVLKDDDFRDDTVNQSGSADVVALVANTPLAIGYSGMGYKTDKVKTVAVAKEEGAEYHQPTVESAASGDYPVSRPLHIYTLGEPEGATKEYLDWIMSDAGQKVLQDIGYVPAPKAG